MESLNLPIPCKFIFRKVTCGNRKSVLSTFTTLLNVPASFLILIKWQYFKQTLRFKRWKTDKILKTF